MSFRFDFKRRIGASWVSHSVQPLPDESYEGCLARQRAIFGADRVEPLAQAEPDHSDAPRVMVNSRTVLKLGNVDLTRLGDEGIPDVLKDEILELAPVQGALGGRAIRQWLHSPKWINIITEGSV